MMKKLVNRTVPMTIQNRPHDNGHQRQKLAGRNETEEIVPSFHLFACHSTTQAARAALSYLANLYPFFLLQLLPGLGARGARN